MSLSFNTSFHKIKSIFQDKQSLPSKQSQNASDCLKDLFQLESCILSVLISLRASFSLVQLMNSLPELILNLNLSHFWNKTFKRDYPCHKIG